MYLTIKNLTKYLDSQLLFNIDYLTVDHAAKIGIIGDNGQGKTTLLNILAQKDRAFSGYLQVKGRSAFVRQLNDFNDLSGGQKTRALLEEAFIQRPELLLLDEPTTHLDEQNVNWLLQRLGRFSGIVIAVSHDRYFLDHFAETIWSFSDHQVKEFKGSLDQFERDLTSRRSHEQKAYQAAGKHRQKLEKAAQITKGHADKLSKNSVRNPVIAKKARALYQLVKNNQRQIANFESVKKVFHKKALKLQNPIDLPKGKKLMKVLNLPVKRNSQTLIDDLTFDITTADKLALIGENGSGKSTAIERILASSAPMVTRSETLKIGYFHQDLSQLDDHKTLLQNILDASLENEQTARDFLGAFGMHRDKVFQATASLSGGEKVKLSLIQVLLSGADLLILDEPTNFLDLSAIAALEQFLIDYRGGLLLVSHDLVLVEAVCNKILKIEKQRIIEI